MASDETPTPNYDARRQARAQEEPPHGRRWLRLIMRIVIAIAVLLLLGVAYWAWYSVTHVKAVAARVRASVVTLSPVIDAHMIELHVDDGDAVAAGDLLARLDDSELQAALAAAEAERRIRAVRHAEAEASLRMTEASVAAGVAQAKASLAVARARSESARAALSARRARLDDEVRRAEAQLAEGRAMLEQLRKGARSEDLEAAETRLASAKAMRELYRLEVSQSEELVGEGIDSQHLLETRKTRLATQENAVREAELVLARMRAGATAEELEAAQQSVIAREAGLALVRGGIHDLEVLKAELAIREAEVSQAEAAMRDAEAQRAAIDIAREQAHAAQAELERAEANVSGRHAALEKATILAPVSGTVTRTFTEVGELCRKGVPIIMVAEEHKGRWIEGFVREDDAMRVNVGQTAQVQVPAHVGPYVNARVTQVGLHTQSLDGPAADVVRSGQPDRVWVRIVPDEDLPGNPVTGTSAKAIIRVR